MKLAVVGLGEFGHALIERLSLEKDLDLEIIAIDKRSLTFRKRYLFDWLRSDVTDEKFFFNYSVFENKFKSFQCLNDRLDRISFNKKTLFFKESEAVVVDKIVICTGSLPQKQDIAKSTKSGIYYLSAIESPFEFRQRIRMFEHVVMSISTSVGFDFLMKIIDFNKDLKVILDVDEKSLDLAKAILTSKGVDFYTGVKIVETFGEGEIKAIKLDSGKFLASDILCLDSVVCANAGFLSDSNYFDTEQDAFTVDNNLRTRFDFCFALGEVIETDLEKRKVFKFSQEKVSKQVDTIVANLKKENVPFVWDETEIELVEFLSRIADCDKVF